MWCIAILPAMEPLPSSLLLNIAKAVLGQVAAKLAEPAAKGLRRRVFGDPEQRALERALQRAYDTTRATHGYALAQYDVNPSFLAYEGAAELARPSFRVRPPHPCGSPNGASTLFPLTWTTTSGKRG